jgi:hypothetical protein
MRIWAVAAAVVVLVALPVWIGGAGSDGGATPKSLADTIGCRASYIADTTDEVGVESVGECILGGGQVRLLTFADDDARDNFVKVAKVSGNRYVIGPGFAVEVKSARTESAVKAKL